jgi:hypothetical protein
MFFCYHETTVIKVRNIITNTGKTNWQSIENAISFLEWKICLETQTTLKIW